MNYTIVIYVSAPYTADNEYNKQLNIAHAFMLAKALWRAGFIAYCPHKNTENLELIIPEIDIFIKADCELIRRFDAIVMGMNWESSFGCSKELQAAYKYNKDIFYWQGTIEKTVDMIIKFYKERTTR